MLLLGIFLVSLPFIGLWAFMVYETDWLEGTIAFWEIILIVFTIVSLIVAGVWIIDSVIS